VVKFRLPGLCQDSDKAVATASDRPVIFTIAEGFFVKRLIFAVHEGNSPRLDSSMLVRDGADGFCYIAAPGLPRRGCRAGTGSIPGTVAAAKNESG
jgi:hypothetical protein